MPAKIFYDQDADLSLLKDKTLSILGYGSQGHAHAQNLRDSGLDVLVAELPGTPNYEQAVADGFEPVSAAEATKRGDMITILLPDGSLPTLPEGLVNPYRVDTSAVLEATEGGGPSEEVAAALGIPSSYQSALAGIPSVILSIRAGGTTFGGFSQRSAPFRWPVDICEGCLTVPACTPEQAVEQCLPGQDGSPGCATIVDPPTTTP